MAWYAAGTVTATNNSGTITGTGTSFIGNVRVGDGIVINGSSSMHEVTGVTSNTQMTIAPVFTGTTGSGKAYRVAPMLGYDKDLSDAFNQIRLNWGSQLSQLKPWAYAPTVDQSLDELGFSAFGKDFVKTASGATGRVLLGLGTGAVRDVTTSNSDTTSGRLIKVGDGGLLAPNVGLPTAWNSADSLAMGCRFQRSNSTIVDGWSVTSSTIVAQPSSNHLAMLAISHASTRAAIGRVNNGAAAVWSELYHQNNILGTVSQSSGVPTGAIIEQGSNANGSYVKFADGTMICTSPIITDTTAALTTASAGGFRGNATGWTFPATFTSSPNVSCFSRGTNNLILGLRILNTTTVQPDYWSAVSSASVACAYQAIAIGRWY